MATILVADDEAAVREFMRMVLSGQGHRVLLAANGREALRLAEAGRVDLLVTDVVPPGGGGRELADRLAGLSPPVRVLFVSGAPGAPDFAARVAAGEVPFLPKPFAPGELCSRVESLLGAAEAGQGERP